MAYNRKRPASWALDTPSKAPRLAGPSSPTPVPKSLFPTGVIFKPQIRYHPHPNSKVGLDFHSVPYPLTLLPYDSWHKLHHPAHVYPSLPFRCPVCTRERETTPHIRKIFLVAERLARDFGSVPTSEKEQNEQLNWAVNYELGILDPCIEDSVQVAGGRQSQTNRFHPYQNEYEMTQALKLIFTSETLTDTSWSLWIGMQRELQEIFKSAEAQCPVPSRVADSSSRPLQPRPNPPAERPYTRNASSWNGPIETIDLTQSPESSPKSRVGALATPPSSTEHHQRASDKHKSPPSTPQHPKAPTSRAALVNEPTDRPPPAHPPREIVSYRTLPDFYSLLDRIEPTSFVGALFLEAYAERLRDDMCRDCWLKRYAE